MRKFKETIFFAFTVLLISLFAIEEFNKSEVEETEKSTKDNIVRDYKSSDVSSIAFKGGDNTYALKREGTQWSVVTPVVDLADSQAVDSMISDLFSQDVEALESDGEKLDPAKYGLNTPLAEYDITFSDGKNLKLTLGSVRTYDKGYYLMRGGRDEILVSGAGWDSLVAKTAENLRSKKLNIDGGQLTELHITSKVKDKQADLQFELVDGDWTYKKDKTIKLQDSVITEYFNKLHLLRADGIVADESDKASLNKNKFIRPDLILELKVNASAEKSQNVRVEFKFDDSNEALMIASVNKPIYKISKSKTNDFAQTLDHFRDKKFPFQYNPSNAVGFEIKKVETPKSIVKFEKTADTWVDVSQPTAKVKQNEAQSFLEGLEKLEVKEFLGQAKGAAKISDKKSNQILVKGANGQVEFSFLFVDDKKPNYYRGVTNLTTEAILVAKSSVDDLINKKFVEGPPAAIKDEKSK